jgi:SAM-dependent methyltransferase
MAKEKYKYDKIYNNEGVYTRNGKIDTTGVVREKYGHEAGGKKHIRLIKKSIKPTSILDVGCGYNELAGFLNKDGIKTIGVDFACPGADIIADASNMPFGDKEHDLITSFDMLEHIPEDELDLVFQEFRRVANKFLYKIALRGAPSRIDGEQLHPCVKTVDWWEDKIIKNHSEISYVSYLKGRTLCRKKEAKKLLIFGFFN